MLIGVAGLARAGKNKFADFAAEYFAVKNLNSSHFAFANELKKDLEEFISDKFGISVWTENTEEKNKIRDLMVVYGRLKREDSNGMYWVDKLRPQIAAATADIKFITDCRHPNDEVKFIKEEGGIVVHVTRLSWDNVFGAYIPNSPINEEESKNDPLVKAKADYRFSWQDFNGDEEAGRAAVWKFLKQNL